MTKKWRVTEAIDHLEYFSHGTPRLGWIRQFGPSKTVHFARQIGTPGARKPKVIYQRPKAILATLGLKAMACQVILRRGYPYSVLILSRYP